MALRNENTGASREQIEQRAYELYLERGEAHGHELEDWFRAEEELLGKQDNFTQDNLRQSSGIDGDSSLHSGAMQTGSSVRDHAGASSAGSERTGANGNSGRQMDERSPSQTEVLAGRGSADASKGTRPNSDRTALPDTRSKGIGKTVGGGSGS